MNERRSLVWATRALVATPFVVALVVLAGSHWNPVLDLAMTEFRVRDVFGGHTPLIGLPGRIGRFPEQGSHPGPLSFYLLAPTHRLFGSSSFGLLAGAVVINVGSAWTALWLAGRRGGRRMLLTVTGVMLAASAWYGVSLLTQPWNPYLPLIPFIVVVLAAWSVIDGDAVALPIVVGFASLCAQTHVPYLTLGVALCGLSFVACVVHARAKATERHRWVRQSAWAVGVGAVIWAPVLVDQLIHSPGNITMLRRHFTSPPEPPVGFGVGVRTMLAHFDPVALITSVWQRTGSSVASLDGLAGGRWQIGAVVVAGWLVAGVASWRLPDRRIWKLHATVAVASAVGLVSSARIFGKVWYYLTLWGWSLGLWAMVATAWTIVAALHIERRVWNRRGWILATLALAVPFCLLVRQAVRAEPPEDRLSTVLRRVVGPTAAALRSGQGAADGPGGRYAVVWSDAYIFGSQGYGLISELERNGLHAGAYDTYRVPVTPQRIVRRDQATAEVVLATGVYIDEWRAKSGVVEVTDTDLRTPDEIAEFDRLRADVHARLQAAGLADLVDMVDHNLFGVSVDARIDQTVEAEVARMLTLGEETAVFIAPPGTF